MRGEDVFWSRDRRALIGLDIGSGAVKAAGLARREGRYRVRAVGSEPLPPRAVVNDTIVDGAVLAQTVTRLLERLQMPRREVAVGLSGAGVMVKQVSLPPMTRREVRGAVDWQARQHIPFESEEVCIDYCVTHPSRSGRRRGTLTASDVNLVAAKKNRVEAYATAVARAGCIARVIDVGAFALQNIYELSYDRPLGSVDVLANVGAASLTLNVVRSGVSLFARSATLEVSEPADAATRDRAVTRRVLEEMGKTLDFCRTTASPQAFDRIVLSGGGSLATDLPRVLVERFGIRVHRLDPFRRLAFDSAVLPDAERRRLGPLVAIALGLALRRVGDATR